MRSRLAVSLVLLVSLSVLNALAISSAIISRSVKLDDLEGLTPDSRAGRTYLAGSGSGVVVSEDGKILTNTHVVNEAAEIVMISGGSAYRLRIVKQNSDVDLALLELDGLAYEVKKTMVLGDLHKDRFVPAKPHAESEVLVGTTVFVAGFPAVRQQGMDVKLTKGIVSSTSGFRGDTRTFQMDAAMYGGNSGCPVLDENGFWVGVAVAKCLKGENANYAIKMSVVREFLGYKQQIRSRSVKHRSCRDGLARATQSSVLLLTYKSGERDFSSVMRSEREEHESMTRVQKSILCARLLRLKKQWRELKDLTEGLLASGCRDQEVFSMNESAKDELGEHLKIFAEVDGRDVKAQIRPLAGFKDGYAVCGETITLADGGLNRGFPVKADLTFVSGSEIWQGHIDEIYDWHGTRVIRVKLIKE